MPIGRRRTSPAWRSLIHASQHPEPPAVPGAACGVNRPRLPRQSGAGGRDIFLPALPV